MKTSYLLLGYCLVLQAIPGNQVNTMTGDTVAVNETDSAFRGPQYRYQHARELLGDSSGVRRDIASSCDEDSRCARDLTNFIYNRTLDLLPASYKQQAPSVAQALIDISNKYQMDPLFLMAVISHESRFNPDALGRHGEIGLMQIKPSTARWLHPEIADSAAELLHNPVENIRLGAA
jgi:soluble lytic murein transglycosylase